MKSKNNIIAVFVACVIFLIIVPLNPAFLDLMLILNITISLSIFLISMYIKEALEFSVFPTILLVTTLFRVALNISSTRLILGKGGEAGAVIKTFGEFVIGGNVVVGIIIFIILVIVQFIVITKGAERVAEVAARFTLDAMPGKQMAIDADLNSGLINEETAKMRRLKIQREADFYGAMDGGSKFVKGDAIVSIIIVFINIIAGTIIGMVQGGQTLGEVIQKYTIATVGDGLVSQFPALLVSTATGMIVTRAASENSLSEDLTGQFTTNPKVFTIAGFVLLFLALIPGFPKLQIIVISAVLIFGGLVLRKKQQIAEAVPAEELPVSETSFYKNTENIYTLLNIDPIEMEFGYSLLPLVDESRGGSFIDRVVMLRRQFATDIGMVIPSVRLRDNASINPNQYIIKLKGEQVAQGDVLVNHLLAMNPGDVDEEIEGIDTVEPAFGLSAKWITEELRDTAVLSGYTVIDPLSVILTHFSEVIKKHAHELLSRQDVAALLDNLKKSNKSVVEDIVPAIISVGDLQKVLSNLLFEQIPIRDLTTILETLAEHAGTTKDTELLTEYVRQALKRTITRKFAPDGKLKVITLNPDLENLIVGSIKKTEHGSYSMLEPDVLQKIVLAHKNEVEKISEIVSNPVILASPVIRFYYKKLIEQFAPDATVLSFNEIETTVQIQALGSISIN
ncbi:MAG: flagellar biosynthesis protein FlhA [Clostridiales bacterium]|jgi:flagellar biosynthesis protein FlhA|nr:flagellar biosynthesis protein FlhA [Clostridiales bacterium]